MSRSIPWWGGKSSSDRNADFIPINHIFIALASQKEKAENLLRCFSEIGNLAGLQLKLQFVSGKGSEHRIPVFARYFDGETEESLRGAAGDLAEK